MLLILIKYPFLSILTFYFTRCACLVFLYLSSKTHYYAASNKQVFDITSLQIFTPHELDHLLCGRRELWEVLFHLNYIISTNYKMWGTVLFYHG